MNWEEKYDALASMIEGYRHERNEAQARVVDAALIHAGLVRERDEALAEVQDYREQLRKLPDANRVASQDAFRRGAEAMREACVNVVLTELSDPWYSDELLQPMRALPIPEEP